MSELSLTRSNVELIQVLIKDTLEDFESNIDIEDSYKVFNSYELNNYLEKNVGYDFNSYYEGLTEEEEEIYNELCDYRESISEEVFRGYTSERHWSGEYIEYSYEYEYESED